jgi:hypothetical protein
MTAVFLIFDVVSAQLQGFSNLRLRRSLVKKSKLLAAHRYIFYVNALANRFQVLVLRRRVLGMEKR